MHIINSQCQGVQWLVKVHLKHVKCCEVWNAITRIAFLNADALYALIFPLLRYVISAFGELLIG